MKFEEYGNSLGKSGFRTLLSSECLTHLSRFCAGKIAGHTSNGISWMRGNFGFDTIGDGRQGFRHDYTNMLDVNGNTHGSPLHCSIPVQSSPFQSIPQFQSSPFHHSSPPNLYTPLYIIDLSCCGRPSSIRQFVHKSFCC